MKKLKKAYPSLITYSSIGKTYDKRNIYEIVIGNKYAKKYIIVQSTVHAREYNNSLLVMRQVEALCANYNNTYKGKRISQLLDKVCLHVIPMANPDGVNISLYGAKEINNKKLRRDVEKMCKKYGKGKKSYYVKWKANARGVDINRNFPLKWKTCNTGVNHRDSGFYKGKSESSELETKHLISHYKRVKPSAVIAYHSSGSVIYWDFLQKGNLRKKNKSLFNTVQKLTGYKDAKSVNGKPKLGPYFGEWSGYKQKVPTLTIETGKGACPIKISEYKTIWKKNRCVLPAVLLWTYNN